LFFDGPVGEPDAAGTTERDLLLLALRAEVATVDASADASFSRCLALARNKTKKTWSFVAACQKKKEEKKGKGTTTTTVGIRDNEREGWKRQVKYL
jgi:hypothetical protein